jgi:hypothetical protein
MHAVVLAFHTLSVPLDAEAMTWSSDETQSVRTSCRCPGSSIECVLAGSGEEPSGNLEAFLEVGEGEGTV